MSPVGVKNQQIQAMLGLLQSYAPNGKAQALCATQFNSVLPQNQKDELQDAQIRHLAGALLDGLKFGNWPWYQ